MRIFVVSQEKGGTGKTLVAHHLACLLAERGRVLAVDLDAQESSLSAVLAARAAPLPALALFAGEAVTPAADGGPLTLAARTRQLDAVDARPVEEMMEAFRAGLGASAATGGYDWCVIDTPPAYGVRTACALAAADRLVAPIELAESSLDAVAEALATVEAVREAAGRPALDFARDKPLLVSRFRGQSARQRAAAERLGEAVGRIMLPGALRQRDAYEATYAARLPVWALRGPDGRMTPAIKEAAAEARAVLGAVVGDAAGAVEVGEAA